MMFNTMYVLLFKEKTDKKNSRSFNQRLRLSCFIVVI